MKIKISAWLPLLFMLININGFSQTLYDVVVGTDNVPITEVQLAFDGTIITETSGGIDPTPAANQTTLPVIVNYVKIDTNTGAGGPEILSLDFFNAAGAFITNNNFTTSAGGVGVYDEGTEFLVNAGLEQWEDAMQDMVNSRNALNYLFYDGGSNIPAGDDFDILWSKALTADDYLAVSERDGNTNFQLIPLDSTGSPITTARELRFGQVNASSASPNGNQKYDWNIGYGSAGRNADQPQYFTIVDVELFQTGGKNIYGFRIDNNGDADVKFYGLSGNSFDDNPSNPIIPSVSGSIFIDQNGLTDNLVNGTTTSTAGSVQLFAKLIKSGVVEKVVQVNSIGEYLFVDVDPGSYTVVLDTTDDANINPRLPSDWIFTGENDGTTSDNIGTVDGISPPIIVTDSLETRINFAIQEFPLITLGDFVWEDTNGNGVQDPGEPPLRGVEVLLYDSLGNPATRITGFDTTATNCPVENVATDMSGNSVSDNDGSINFNGDWNLSVTTGGGSGLSYFDEIDNGEISVSGRDGEISRNITPPSFPTIDTVIVSFSLKQVGFDGTDDNGIVEYYNGTSWVQLGDFTQANSLTSSGVYYDFEYIGHPNSIPDLLNIQGIRFIEGSWASNSEGFYADDIDVTFKSVCTYTVDTLTEIVKDTTDENGFYSFSTLDDDVLASSKYEIRIPLAQDSLDGLVLTGTGAGTSATDNNGSLGGGGAYATSGLIATPSGNGDEDLSIDFGFVGYSIGNSIWWDNDNDGIKDDDEIGIEGVTVILLDDEGNTVATTTTDASGNYIFNGLREGDYQVAVTSPLNSGVLDGATVSSTTNTTADTDGNNDGSATDPVGATNTPSFTSISNTITLGNAAEPTDEDDEDPGQFQPDNQSNLTIDFGFEPPTTALGNAVFWDKGNDGVFTPGVDSALGGIKVYLYQDTNGDGTPNEIIDSVFTDNNGEYSFEDIGAGVFRLVLAPDNFESDGPLSTGNATTHTNSGDAVTDDNSEGSQSGIITLTPNTQPTADANDGSLPGIQDNDANYTFDFGIYGDNGGPVPVELVYFSAEKQGKTSVLTWETASELNNSHFDIERRTETTSWEVIGHRYGNRTTQDVSNYYFIDYNPSNGGNHYRLKQVDFDGQFEYSEVRTLIFDTEGSITLYPNPTQGKVYLQLDEVRSNTFHIKITNALGTVVQEEDVKSVNQIIPVDLSPFGRGIFFLEVDSSIHSQIFRVIKTD